MRTSNNYNNDDVTLFWQSNFGFFDARRSFTDEPWQGSIEAIRLDPVVRFLDILLAPTDGWFEIDSVAIY